MHADSMGPLLVIIIVGGVVLVIAVVLVRRILEEGLFDRAASLHASGQNERALRFLLKAEANWAFNHAHATPKAFISDLCRLKKISSLCAEILSEMGRSLDISQMHSAIQRLVDLYGDRANFRWGTHTLKSDKVDMEKQLLHALAIARESLREQAFTSNNTTASVTVPASAPDSNDPTPPVPDPGLTSPVGGTRRPFGPTSGLPYCVSILLVVVAYAVITRRVPGIVEAVWLVPVVLVLGTIIAALLNTMRAGRK